MSPVAGVILAGGASTRMGTPKALLAVGGETFLTRAVRTARAGGLDPLVVVTGPAHAEIVACHGELAPLLVRNPRPEEGQLSSLRVGLAALPPAVDAVVMLLVDHPLVQAETVRALLRARLARRTAIAVPVYARRRGHPVLFGREVFAELAAGPLEAGARAVVGADPARVVEVEVQDPGILTDVDTPAEYARMVTHG